MVCLGIKSKYKIFNKYILLISLIQFVGFFTPCEIDRGKNPRLIYSHSVHKHVLADLEKDIIILLHV